MLWLERSSHSVKAHKEMDRGVDLVQFSEQIRVLHLRGC